MSGPTSRASPVCRWLGLHVTTREEAWEAAAAGYTHDMAAILLGVCTPGLKYAWGNGMEPECRAPCMWRGTANQPRTETDAP